MMRRGALIGGLATVVVVVWLLWPGGYSPARTERETASANRNGSSMSGETLRRSHGGALVGSSPLDPGTLATDFPIVAPLNLPTSTITRDLETLAHVFDAWRTSFPRDGNPVGENAEITAALAGENSLGLVLIPRQHSAINEAGELCDRWGTPFRFHQVSGQHMEIRSAGPDRQFATPDDATWSPVP